MLCYHTDTICSQSSNLMSFGCLLSGMLQPGSKQMWTLEGKAWTNAKQNATTASLSITGLPPESICWETFTFCVANPKCSPLWPQVNPWWEWNVPLLLLWTRNKAAESSQSNCFQKSHSRGNESSAFNQHAARDRHERGSKVPLTDFAFSLRMWPLGWV